MGAEGMGARAALGAAGPASASGGASATSGVSAADLASMTPTTSSAGGASATSSAYATSAAPAAPQRATVLVVDDDLSLRRAIVGMLAAGGYTCVEAADGAEALSVCRALSPDAVVLDVMMPRVDGLEVVRRLRAAGDQTPVLVLSAKGGLSDKEEAFASGADDYLVKPFGIDELLMRVRALLRRAGLRPAAAAEVVRCGALEVDVAHACASLAGTRLDLKPKEARILALLAAHAGEVLSKEDIVRAVWGPEYVGTSINIPVYIRHLREKVEPDPGNPRYILTDWGAGYSLGTRAL